MNFIFSLIITFIKLKILKLSYCYIMLCLQILKFTLLIQLNNLIYNNVIFFFYKISNVIYLKKFFLKIKVLSKCLIL